MASGEMTVDKPREVNHDINVFTTGTLLTDRYFPRIRTLSLEQVSPRFCANRIIDYGAARIASS